MKTAYFEIKVCRYNVIVLAYPHCIHAYIRLILTRGARWHLEEPKCAQPTRKNVFSRNFEINSIYLYSYFCSSVINKTKLFTDVCRSCFWPAGDSTTL